MLMKIQISTLPSWVTGSRLSESLLREKVNVPPAVPVDAAVGCGPLVGLFWSTVIGPLVAAGAAGTVGAAVPHAASSCPIAPATLAPATIRRNCRRLSRRGPSVCSEIVSTVVALLMRKVGKKGYTIGQQLSLN